MNILVIGGTRFFGIHMVNELLAKGHEVTIATRGLTEDSFGDKVKRIILDHSNPESIRQALTGIRFDVAIDKIAYCSNDIRYIMDVVECNKFIHMSSTAVYEPLHMDTKEEEFDGNEKKLIWCNRTDASYDEVKRQAECTLCQKYQDKNWVAVRYPYVIGTDDYTKRLKFYVEHVVKGIPMYIDNIDSQMGFIRSEEAGKFLAFLVDKEYQGAINGCSHGTISMREVIEYVVKKTGKEAVLSENGEPAPYNGQEAYSVNVERAEALGYGFSNIKDWIYELLEMYILQSYISM